MKELDFGVLLGLAFNQFVAELHERLAEEGFTHIRSSFGFAFKLLATESLTTSELAARLGITPQGAAKTVEEMVTAGYVERIPDPTDKRVKRLVLTERCQSLLAVAHEFHVDFESRLSTGQGAQRVAALRELLNAIVDRAESPDSLARAIRQI